MNAGCDFFLVVQDSSKRSTARQLMEFKFFNHVKHKSGWQRRSIVRSRLINGLPNIVERVRQMRAGEGGHSVERVQQAESASMEEYCKSISQDTWNWKFGGGSDFDLGQVLVRCIATGGKTC